MKLDELIERLQNLREELGNGDGEVRLASQPSYPLRHVIANVSAEAYWGDPHSDVVWIALDQDEDQPYASADAWHG